jgi:hypothetical protein
MSKRLPYLLTLLAGLLTCCCFIAAKAPTAAKQYDYVTLTQVVDQLEVASTPNKFERIKAKKDTKAFDHDFNALFNKVSELEAQGYELVENTLTPYSNGNTVSRNYVLMRRPKQ